MTAGFPDILVRREGGKTNPWDYSKDYPEPYVPRQLTFEIQERMTAEGIAAVAFDEAAALYRKILARNPKSEECLVNLVTIGMARKDDAMTRDFSEKLLTLRLAPGSKMMPPLQRTIDVRIAGDKSSRRIIFTGRPVSEKLSVP